VSAESIFSKPLSKKQKAVLSRIAKRQAAGDDSGIDYSDIPPLSNEQLARFRRTPKVLVAARIDREVLRLAHAVWPGLLHPDQQHSAYGNGAGAVVAG